MKDTIVRRKNRNVRTRFCEHLSKIVHPLLPWTKTTRDRSILLHFEERGILLLCLSPLRSTRERGSKKVCFKGSTLILFQLQKSACESKKSCSRTNRRVVNFRALWRAHRYIVLWSHLFLLSFFFFFYYYYYSIYVFRVFEYSYRIFDGTETLGNFIFTRGNIFSSFPIFSGITSFYRNDLDFSLRLELRRASRRRLNLILSCFIYHFVHLIWNGFL